MTQVRLTEAKLFTEKTTCFSASLELQQHIQGNTRSSVCVCVCAHTCIFVVCWGFWSLCGAALLEKEGGPFDHEETLAEAEGGAKGSRGERSSQSGVGQSHEGELLK